MLKSPVFAESEALAAELLPIFDLPRFDNSSRNRVSYLACSVSLEHWHAVRQLLQTGLLPSGLVVHRAQYEALVRGVWALYAASDVQVEKLAAELTTDAEQAAKNLPLVAEMMEALSAKAPPEPVMALDQFKESSWKVLNSYVHAGIHPLHRHGEGYPVQIFEQVTRNANGIALMGTIQAAILTGNQRLVKEVFALQHSYANCLPTRTDA